MQPLPTDDEPETTGQLRSLSATPATVGELMSPAPEPIGEFMSVVAVARRMRALGITSVPVSDDRNNFLGMLSHRDIVEQCVADGQTPSAVPAGSLLAGIQPAINPQHSADRSVLTMILGQQHGELPVVDNGRLVGLITVADMAAPMFDDPDLLDDPGALDDGDDGWLKDSATGS